jgi:predicted TPR repeat methyltransferase
MSFVLMEQHDDRPLAGPDTNDAEAEISLGYLLLKEGHSEEGFAALRRAIALDPGHIDARRHLALALRHYERFDDAEAVLREWMSHDPGHPVPRHMLAAFGRSAVPARAADDYVQLMFDHVALEYDGNLENLSYRGPALVARALEAALGAAGAGLEILDAGCGTGLCGPALRPYARHLAGVDLSPRMLSQAAGRGSYDQLECAELTSFMNGCPDAFDLVVAADTLVYFGDLTPVLAAAARALRSRGRLIFTVEAAPPQSPGSQLNSNGRFVHTADYLMQELDRAKLTVRAIESDFLRHEAGRPVAGFVITAQKTDTDRPGEAP